MLKNKLKILLKPSYRATAEKLGLDPDEVYENDPVLLQQGYDMLEAEITPGDTFTIPDRFEHGIIYWDGVNYVLLGEEYDEFELTENGDFILKPGDYIFHTDGITIEPADASYEENTDEDDNFDDENEEEIDPIEQLILDTITNSAKRRFDYAEFENGFSPHGAQVPHNILSEIIGLLALGEAPVIVSAKIFSQLLLSGLFCDKNEFYRFVADKTEELKLEVYILGLAGQMLRDGTTPPAVLDFVRKMLN